MAFDKYYSKEEITKRLRLKLQPKPKPTLMMDQLRQAAQKRRLPTAKTKGIR